MNFGNPKNEKQIMENLPKEKENNEGPLIGENQIVEFEREIHDIPRHQVINKVGGDGIYQRLILVGLIIPAIGILAFVSLFSQFTLMPNFLCKEKESQGSYYSCKIEQVCSNDYDFKVDENSSNSNFISDFSLYCRYDLSIHLLITMLGIGILIGSIIFVPLGDRFGRKISIMISSFISLILILSCIFIKTLFLLQIVFLLQAVVIVIFCANLLVYMLEICSCPSRTFFGSYILFVLPLSGLINEILFQLIRSWKIVLIINSILIIIFVFYSPYFFESPRFLISRNDYPEAKLNLLNIAKCNKKNIRDLSIMGEQIKYNKEYHEDDQSRKQNIFVIFELFAPNCIIRTLTIFAQSFCLSVLFIGVGFISVPIFQNVFFDNIFNYTIDLLNIIFTGFLSLILGRKYTIFLAVTISAGLTVLTFFFSFIGEMYYGATLWLTRIFCVAAFTANKIYCVELFPTRIRSSGAGIIFSATALGIIFTYYISLIPFQVQYIYGGLGLVSIFIMGYLEETNGVELKEDFDYKLSEKSESNEGYLMKGIDVKIK